MANLPINVAKFGAEHNNTDLFVKFQDYFKHFSAEVNGKNYGAYDTQHSLMEKDQKIYEAFKSEVEKGANVKLTKENIPAMAQHPVVGWVTMSILDAMVEAILPMTMIDSIGLYTELKTGGYGDSFNFRVKPNSLFVVSRGANAQRTSFVQKQFDGNATLVPENHAVTVEVAKYKILAGEESLAEFARKAALAIQTEMTKDAYTALTGAFSASTFPQALTVTGYTATDLLGLVQKVGAYNSGIKPVIAGTPLALSHILPEGSSGYRITTPADNMQMKLIRDFYDYDVMSLPQVATGDYTNYGTVLKDNELYILSPGSDKLVKGALEGSTLSNTNQPDDNANLTSNLTLNKRWQFGVITNSTAGILKLQ